MHQELTRPRRVGKRREKARGVLAPTATATATLITCSGQWDAGLRMYERRLIVTVDYEGAD
jgi:hypothetical protein